MRHWLGWMLLAAGLPCWLMGLALEQQIAGMVSAVHAAGISPESTARNVAWVKDTYWFAPYLLWAGGALVALGSLLGIIGLVWRKSDDNVGATAGNERHWHP